MGQLKRKKYKLRNHRTSKVEQLKRRRYNHRYHRTLEEGVKGKKKPEGIQEHEKVEAIPAPKEKTSKIQHLDIKP